MTTPPFGCWNVLSDNIVDITKTSHYKVRAGDE